MVKKLKKIKAAEFIKKILAGERDFSGIELPQETKLNSEQTKILNAYLKSQDLKSNPIILRGSCLWKFNTIKGIYLPFTDFGEASVQYSDLFEADLESANFRKAELEGTDFSYADLSNANFEHARLSEAVFKHSCLRGANFNLAYIIGANFKRADLRDAKNLDRALEIEEAYFKQTTVSKKDEKYLIRKLPKQVVGAK